MSTETMSHQLSDQEVVRRESLKRLRELGIDPFPAAQFPITHSAAELKQHYEEGAEGFDAVCIAGRLKSVRVMGKASFAVIKDPSGEQQIYVNRDEICPGEDKTLYNEVFKKLLDLGDFIGVKGEMFVTKTGEKSVRVKELTVLSKSLRPLPVVKTDEDGNVHDAFADPELRHRMRYVDLAVNDEVKKTFLTRTKITNSMRSFMDNHGYVEVDTPILQPIPGGAAAKPFITHHNALDMPLYLRIANELYLKRLIVGGFEGVYEFARDFRNEGMDRAHNPEFTVMELYVAYKDYIWMMEFVEQMMEHVAMKALGTTEVKFQEHTLQMKAPFKRITMCGSLKEATGVDVLDATEKDLRELCKKHHIELEDSMGKAKLIDELFGAIIEPTLVQPTFVMDFPVEMSPLCKRHRDDPRLTERFELYMANFETANAYSELNDPIDQRERFEEQIKLQERGDDEAMFIDQDFLRALEYGMPPTSGVGIGFDRLVMILTNNPTIQEVLLFPQLRPEQPTS